jgi:ABC-type glutathione transport system ATPase component
MSRLVEIRGLNVRFAGERTVYAVNDLSLSLGDGEVLGLLGESGSGKSVTLRALMRLLPKKRTQISGSVQVLGRNAQRLQPGREFPGRLESSRRRIMDRLERSASANARVTGGVSHDNVQ